MFVYRSLSGQFSADQQLIFETVAARGLSIDGKRAFFLHNLVMRRIAASKMQSICGTKENDEGSWRNHNYNRL